MMRYGVRYKSAGRTFAEFEARQDARLFLRALKDYGEDVSLIEVVDREEAGA